MDAAVRPVLLDVAIFFVKSTEIALIRTSYQHGCAAPTYVVL